MPGRGPSTSERHPQNGPHAPGEDLTLHSWWRKQGSVLAALSVNLRNTTKKSRTDKQRSDKLAFIKTTKFAL